MSDRSCRTLATLQGLRQEPLAFGMPVAFWVPRPSWGPNSLQVRPPLWAPSSLQCSWPCALLPHAPHSPSLAQVCLSLDTPPFSGPLPDPGPQDPSAPPSLLMTI